MTLTDSSAYEPTNDLAPPERRADLGESIAAHRLYIGLSQRGMARKLNIDRRTYQRIEKGDDLCPDGVFKDVLRLVISFDHVVDEILAIAARDGELNIEVNDDPQWEWERAIAFRAHVIAAGEKDGPMIKLTYVVDPPAPAGKAVEA